uniref:Uncharacterized protein n=1 Tax=Astyanax mexicanus TaxID=7994 RepID=A0A3B1K6S4_ASTMX
SLLSLHGLSNTQYVQGLDTEQDEYAHGHSENPEPKGNDFCIASPSQPPCFHRQHQRKVAVDVHHHQHVNASIHKLPIRPVEVVEDVHGPECQVAQVDLRYSPNKRIPENSSQTQHKDVRRHDGMN